MEYVQFSSNGLDYAEESMPLTLFPVPCSIKYFSLQENENCLWGPTNLVNRKYTEKYFIWKKKLTENISVLIGSEEAVDKFYKVNMLYSSR